MRGLFVLALLVVGFSSLAGFASSAHAGGFGSAPILPAPSTPSDSPDTLCPPSGCGGGGGSGYTCANNPKFGGYYSYAGREKQTSPAIGGHISATVRMNYDVMYVNANHVADWVGTVNSGGDAWIQAGVEETQGDTTHPGLRLYLEYSPGGFNNVPIDLGPASYGVNYTVVITKVSSTSWTASVNGLGGGTTYNLNFSGYNEQYTSESYDLVSNNCNFLDATIASTYPWARTQMFAALDSPDYFQNEGTNGWESIQP